MSAIPAWARVGAKVVFVDGRPGRIREPSKPLVVGEVYVLRTVSDEFSEPACQVVGDGLRWHEFMLLSRFRPVQTVTLSSDIAEHFEHLLDVPASHEREAA